MVTWMRAPDCCWNIWICWPPLSMTMPTQSFGIMYVSSLKPEGVLW